MATSSRWWWWIAGVPAGTAFWVITVIWLYIATHGSGLDANPLTAAVSLATLVLGVPLLVIAVLFPIATYYDARALAAAGKSEFDPRWLSAVAAASLLTGPLLAVPLACWYLYHRHAQVQIP